MLTRTLGLLALGGLAAGGLGGVARADPTPAPVVVSGDNNGGWVDTSVVSPSRAETGAKPAGTGRSDAAKANVTCAWTEQLPTAAAAWAGLGMSQPEGAWYSVRCSDGRSYRDIYVPFGGGNAPPAVMLAGSLAQTAVNRLQLPAPQVGHSPAGQALVGLATWFWVEPAGWRVLRQRTSAGPVWAEVTATPVSTSWDPGDGSPAFTCAGPGTPYDRSRPESAQSTDCSYTYRRSSAGQPQTGPDSNDRYFTVTVSTTWQVTWTGSAGSGGTLAALTRVGRIALPVAQRQTVVTGGSG